MTPVGRPRDSVAVGSILREAAVLTLRCAPIIVIAMAAMAEACMLIFDLLGRCFSGFDAACSIGLYLALGSDPFDVQDNAASIGHELATFAVVAPALYLMFSSRHFAPRHHQLLAVSMRRSLSFLARVSVSWIIIMSPAWLAELASSTFLKRLTDTDVSRILQVVIYLGGAIVTVVCMSALRARLALYLPSAAYDAEPMALRRCWHAVRPVAVRLFAAFFVVDAATMVLELAVVIVCFRYYRELGLDNWARSLAASSGANLTYLHRAVPGTIVLVLFYAPASLLQAAVSVAVYRRLATGDDRGLATVFD